MPRRTWPVAFALLAALNGCADREPATAPSAASSAEFAARETSHLERVARRFALALADPDFRAEVKRQLDASPFPEHKIHLRHFLAASGGRARGALARAGGGVREAEVDAEVEAAPQLEVYLPVPDHRARWNGGEDLLVATALQDRDEPIAFSLRGERQVLNPDRPPATPVLALVPVETDFDRPLAALQAICPPDLGCGGGGGGGIGAVAPSPGLYLTASHFVKDFEGWLKGSPEFEIHIMGQSGATDSLTDYQCAGEHAAGPYAFDQNNLDWSGSVMLFSQSQIDSYKAKHPGQSFRIVALEDDDTACQIKVDQDRWKAVISSAGPIYRDITGAIDTASVPRLIKAAKNLQNFLSALASWITSSDDLIGNAIEDRIVGEYHVGANWIVKGETNVTNGWLKLEMK
jgi:hypothetical protein